jgi:hypothetical protein
MNNPIITFCNNITIFQIKENANKLQIPEYNTMAHI